MFKPIGSPFKRVAVSVVEYPVKQSCCQHRITHHLCPIGYLFVGSKDDGGSLVGITDKSEESVRLAPADWCITYLINDDQLSFLEVLKPEAGGALGFCIIKDLYKVDHLLKVSPQS